MNIAPRLAKASAVCKLLGGISKPTLRKMVDAGDLPAPVRFGVRVYLFDLDAIEAVISSKLADVRNARH